MKQYDLNATKLNVIFNDGSNNCWEINEIPTGNLLAEHIGDSENSIEVISDDEKYRAILYANIAEGQIEIYNNETDEEITDFEVKSIVETPDSGIDE